MGSIGSFTLRVALMFAGLFAGAIGLALLGIQISIADTARTNAARDMAETAARFEREWSAAARVMHGEARLLAKDFGFRRAAATGDAPTIGSALGNLADRGGRPLALFVSRDGAVYGERTAASIPQAALAAALEQGRGSGTLRIGADSYWTVAEAVEAPHLIGWVLFGERLGRHGLGRGAFAPPPFMQVDLRTDRDARRRAGADMPAAQGGAGTPVRTVPLPTLIPGAPAAVFVLSFSLDAATAEYRAVAIEAATICLLVLLLGIAASWLIARRVSRPIDALGAAVDEVVAGRQVALEMRGGDVIGRMARGLSGVSQTIAELSHSARHDALTLLPNRRAFNELVEAALSAELPAALVLVDLDRFKPVNDTYGHPVGDALLQGIAARLKDAAERQEGAAARLGGDEFAVLMTGERAEDRAIAATRAFLAALARPVDALGISVGAGASAGIASAPRDGRRLADLVAAADVALYRAKSAGRGRMSRFSAPNIRLVTGDADSRAPKVAAGRARRR